jgi:hypothetical protein
MHHLKEVTNKQTKKISIIKICKQQHYMTEFCIFTHKLFLKNYPWLQPNLYCLNLYHNTKRFDLRLSNRYDEEHKGAEFTANKSLEP